MQGLNFDSFKATEGNRAALEACRAVATLDRSEAGVIVLVGGKGAGKTHLLWSIVNAVRAGSLRMGLALIMAHEFPVKVRNLVDDPGPIQGGKRAVLLVDGLDSFRDNADELEAVVRVFLENGHNAVLTTPQPLETLDRLSDGFKALLAEGDVMSLASETSEGLDAPVLVEAPRASPPLPEDDGGDEEKRNARRQETNALKAKLEIALAEQERLKELAEHPKAIEAVKAQNAETMHALGQQLSEARSENQGLMARLEEAQGEIRSVEERLEDFESEASSAMAEQARLQGMLGAKAGIEESLEAAVAGRDAALEKQQALEAEAERLLGRVEAWQAERSGAEAAAQAAAERLQEDMEAKEALLASTEEVDRLHQELSEANAQLAGLHAVIVEKQKEFDLALGRATEEKEQYEQELGMLGDEHSQVRAALDKSQGILGGTELELEKARRQHGFLTAEMDALRQEAASQVASATIQAGEMERRIGALESALDILRESGRAASVDIRKRSKYLGQTARDLIALSARLASIKDIRVASSETPVADNRQITLFDALPSSGKDASLPETGLDQHAGLREAVEQALFREDDSSAER